MKKKVVEQNALIMLVEEELGFSFSEIMRDLHDRDCMNPRTIRLRGKEVEVPCGKCWICEKRRKSQWVLRLSEELKDAKCAFWLTLTYDESQVPIGEITDINFDGTIVNETFNVLNKRDHQLFLKLVRKKLGNIKLRYFLVGEYGPKSYRPHYHVLLFLDSVVDYWVFDNIIKQSWTKGYYMLKKPTKEHLNYCAKYTISIPDLPDRYCIAPQYMCCSKGIGKSFLTESMINYYRNLLRNEETSSTSVNKMLCNGYSYALPRYYKDRIFNKFEKNQIGHKTQANRTRKREAKQTFFKYVIDYERTHKNSHPWYISYSQADSEICRNLAEQGEKWRNRNMKSKKI